MALESSINKWSFDNIPSVQIVCDGSSDSASSFDSDDEQQSSTPQRNTPKSQTDKFSTLKKPSLLPPPEDDVAHERHEEIERSRVSHDCNLAALHLTALPRGLPLGTLTKLNLSDNHLTSLPGAAFVGRCGEQLRELYVHSNRLRFLPATLLRLPMLEVLSLSYNRLHDLPFASNARSSSNGGRRDHSGAHRPILPALRRVSLEFNELRRFPIEFFEHCTNLDEVLLSQNRPMLEVPVPYERLLHCTLAKRAASSPGRQVLLKLDNSPCVMHGVEAQRWATTLPWLKLELHKIYPDHLLDYIYLGSLRTAQTPAVYEDLDIRYILTIGRDLEVTVEPGMHHLVLPVNDFPEEDMAPLFEQAFDFIDAARAAGKGVLIHCFAGLSRSVTVAAAYLMKKMDMTRDEALALIRQVRPAARPNEGFMEGLLRYEAALRHVDPPLTPPPS